MADLLPLVGAVPPGGPEVRVSVIEVDYGTAHEPDPSWSIVFAFKGPGFSSGFRVDDPGSHTLSEWMDLAAGYRGISFFRGNGEGRVDVDDDHLTFVAAPSGRGGDVALEFRLRRERVLPHLRAIQDAKARGLPFAKEKV